MITWSNASVTKSFPGKAIEWCVFEIEFARKARPLRVFRTFAKFRKERASYNGSIEASQASDVGSIPIARSRFLDDSVVLTPLFPLKNVIEPLPKVVSGHLRAEPFSRSRPNRPCGRIRDLLATVILATFLSDC